MIKLTNILREATQPQFEPVKLNWKYDEYEPAIDAETMKVHYTKHYIGYIDKLNAAVKKENIPVVFDEKMGGIQRILATVSQYSDVVRNNGGGFFNHTIWFDQLNPKAKGKIFGLAEVMINDQYGSYDKFCKEFKDAGLAHFGSGWVWLMYDKSRLYITTTSNQDNPYMDTINQPGKILIGIDLWEHSYYLKYKNDREKYLDNVFKLLCYDMINDRLQRAINSLTY